MLVQSLYYLLYFFEWAISGLFLFYFHLFYKQTMQFLQQINVNKCPSSLWYQDLNTQPLEHESPPITPRPELTAHLYLLI